MSLWVQLQLTLNMKISMIVAINNKRVIGIDNQLPWHLPSDLVHFKKTTQYCPIIMGRKTYESIGKPLPKRTNIVLTTNVNYRPLGCLMAQDLDQAIEIGTQHVKNSQSIFIIGGAQIYAQALPRCQTLYLTVVDNDISGDTYFPESLDSICKKGWHIQEMVSHPPDVKHQFGFTIYTLQNSSF